LSNNIWLYTYQEILNNNFGNKEFKMGNQISDFKAWLYRLQLWLERNPKLHKAIIYIYALFSIGLVILGFFMVYDNILKPLMFILLTLLLVLLIFIDNQHVEMIKKNRFELEQRKRLISELVSTGKNRYLIKYRREIFEIEKDGDATYTREMILEYDNVDVLWAEMLFGSTNEFGSNFDRMILYAYTYPDTKHPLSRIPIEATGSRMRFAVILRNKITNLHRFEGFQISMKWMQVWKVLMNTKKDEGILRIDCDTRECVLELRLPMGYSFVDFRMPRTNGELVLNGKIDDGRSYLTYTLYELLKSEAYNYFVEIRKS
jgi:hypothetical protein